MRPFDGRRILVAEDGADLSKIYRALFERSGAEVSVAGDGEAAVAEWRSANRRGRPFDAAVLDLAMPKMRGTEVAASLRASGFGGALVGVSAYANAEQSELWLAAGCDAVVPKDRPWDDLVGEIAGALARREADGGG